MYQKFSMPEPPAQLLDYLRPNLAPDAHKLRLRAVLTQSVSDVWQLVCCTVEALPGCEARAGDVGTRRYVKAVLYEDWLTVADCQQFIDGVQRGELTFDDIRLNRGWPSQWQTQLVPLKNYYMARAGIVVATRFQESAVEIAQDPLLAVSAPYYPDLTEAARDWLPFSVYNGGSDARNGEIVFLLPEARAFFSSASFREGVLSIDVQGSAVEALMLVVKGAYWEGSLITHFERGVADGVAAIAIPEKVDRLDLVLMDSNGNVYDFQKEDRYSNSGLAGLIPAPPDDDLVQQIRTACLDGEGTQVEFKPFLPLRDKPGENKREGKLLEVLKTVVSFANTRGGRIYIGVNDDCTVAGARDGLEKWAKAEVDDVTLVRYCGILANWIRGHVVGEVHMRLSHANVDEEFVVVVEVSEAMKKPVEISNDKLLYVRSGANNRPLPPRQWEHIIQGNVANMAVFHERNPDFGE